MEEPRSVKYLLPLTNARSVNLSVSVGKQEIKHQLRLEQSVTPTFDSIDSLILCDATEDMEAMTRDEEEDTKKEQASNDHDIKTFVAENGFTIVRKICDTTQGQLYEGIDIKNNTRVAIKKVNKILYQRKECVLEDGTIVLTDEHIVKEAIISKYLTVYNTPPFDFIAKFVSFFENDNDVYLVSEYCAGNMNLSEFIECAHKYIKQGRLKLRKWRKIMKYLFWQLTCVVYWLHNDMNCCHLDLCTANIMVENGNFLCENVIDGAITIDDNVNIKVVDFGLSEVWSEQENGREKGQKCQSFDCFKWMESENHSMKSPEIFNEWVYDAKKADIWSLGIIFFNLCFGCDPFVYQNGQMDKGFWLLRKSRIGELVDHVCCSNHHFYNRKMASLIKGMLHFNENKRFTVNDIMCHAWFSTYFGEYQSAIVKTKRSVFKIDTDVFPYYDLQNSVKDVYDQMNQ